MRTKLRRCIKAAVTLAVIAVIAAAVVLSAHLLLKKQKVSANVPGENVLKVSENTVADNMTEAFELSEEKSTQMDTEVSAEDEADDTLYATSHKTEPVTQDIIRIADMYAVKGDLTLKSYYPDAVGYTWELYDTDAKSWKILDSETVYDELYRPVSSISLDLEQDIMVRCEVEKENSEERITDVATVKCIQSVTGISAAQEQVETGTGWLCSRDIPVKVTYRDNSSETLSGLYGLVFVDSLESSEVTYSDTGNMIETITTVSTECEYSYVNAGEKEFVIRYRDKDKMYDTNLTVVSADKEAPVISAVSISDFEISNIDKPVTVEVSITAEDNETSYPELMYAFLPQETEPEEADWTANPKLKKEIDKNGVWIAYCRDKSGNIAAFEKKIIAVDQKAPELALTLEHSEWCQSNKIIADARDELSITYLFTCPETGEDSGWIDRNEYDVTKNGTWEVQAKDAAGNTAVKEITVSNIDTQMPIIKGITEGERIYEN
jgi:hypothetical protein